MYWWLESGNVWIGWYLVGETRCFFYRNFCIQKLGLHGDLRLEASYGLEGCCVGGWCSCVWEEQSREAREGCCHCEGNLELIEGKGKSITGGKVADNPHNLLCKLVRLVVIIHIHFAFSTLWSCQTTCKCS